MKKNLSQKLRERKVKKPNIFSILIAKTYFLIASKKNHINYIYTFDKKVLNNKNQILILSSHSTYRDYSFVLHGLRKLSPNVVCGYEHFFIRFLYSFLISLGAIPKCLYQPDLKCIRDIDWLIKKGQSILVFPEGIQSTSGSSHPINPSTIKFLFKYKLPVITCKSYGSYLAYPRFSKDVRKGKITYQYDYVLTKEDYEKYSIEEIYEKIKNALYFNDFEYNKKAKEKYIGKYKNAKGLDSILYICPDCKKEFTLSVKDEYVECESCGYKVKVDEYYNLSLINGKSLPINIDAWYKWQRSLVKKEILDSNFNLCGEFDLYKINDKHLNFKTQKYVGSGKCNLDKNEFYYKGTLDNKEVELKFPLSALPSIPFSPNKCVDVYYQNVLYTFYKKDNPKEVVKWMLAEEELHNLIDEKWRKVSEDSYKFDDSMIINGDVNE